MKKIARGLGIMAVLLLSTACATKAEHDNLENQLNDWMQDELKPWVAAVGPVICDIYNKNKADRTSPTNSAVPAPPGYAAQTVDFCDSGTEPSSTPAPPPIFGQD